ncbi:solute carrier family 22 member 7-like [Acanthochromis polyacanthus]|uniref:solute carrier family 22 member 7-like n=1 Tax=Acanthochromis polyacanthus TaxID=80966 RepID=UPI002234DBD4|nr:solute carrier family 22 member 7-like [Acanthochromis polyacanthus]
MKFENILAEINGFGRFQVMIIVINFIGRFTLPCHFMLSNFIAAVPAHHCDISSLDDGGVFMNLSHAERLVVSIPVQQDGTPSSCSMFTEPQYHLLLNFSDITDAPTVPCQNGWVYDNTTFKSTLTSEWTWYGRRIMLLVSYVSGMLFAIASAFSTTYVMFAVLRFFTGFCITGIVIVSQVLSVEWVDIEHRKVVGVIDSLSWTVGNIGFAAIAYFVNDWRWLITLATIIVTDKRDRSYSYLDLVRTPEMRKLALRTGLLWYCIANAYYGISLNIASFGLSLYLTQLTYALIELPCKLSNYYLLDRVGRRSTEVGALLVTGACLGINILIPKDMSVARTVVAIIGKGFSSVSFATVVLYSSELYPTVVRQNGMGYNSFMGRFGVAVAPLILLLDEVWKDLPQAVLCCTAFLGAMVARTLAETRNRCLPETIEDVEQKQ